MEIAPWLLVGLILALKPQEETPARTPWWLILLRILLATLIILALAHPLLHPGSGLRGSGPVVIDVRTPEEFASGHIPGAINIAFDQVAKRIAEVADVIEFHPAACLGV